MAWQDEDRTLAGVAAGVMPHPDTVARFQKEGLMIGSDLTHVGRIRVAAFKKYRDASQGTLSGSLPYRDD